MQQTDKRSTSSERHPERANDRARNVDTDGKCECDFLVARKRDEKHFLKSALRFAETLSDTIEHLECRATRHRFRVSSSLSNQRLNHEPFFLRLLMASKSSCSSRQICAVCETRVKIVYCALQQKCRLERGDRVDCTPPSGFGARHCRLSIFISVKKLLFFGCTKEIKIVLVYFERARQEMLKQNAKL